MPNEIYHRSNWGNANAEGFGDVYFDAAATNKLYNHSDYYENSDGTDKILKDLSNKASIVLTPTAYSDGSLNTVIPPYQVLPTELVTNGTFDTDSDWLKFNGATISNGVAELDDVSGSVIQQGITTEVGKRYNINANITGLGNDYYLCVGTGVGTGSTNRNVLHSQSLSATFVATSTLSYIGVRNNLNNNTYTIDNVSVKEIQEADFDFSRGSSATRVNEQGLVEDVQILSGELVQNGDFEQIGSELVTNGNFDTDSDWIKGTGWSISDGKAIYTGTTNSDLAQSGILTSGKLYKLQYEVINSTLVNGVVKLSGTTASAQNVLSQTVGTHTLYFTANGTAPTSFNIRIVLNTSGQFEIDNVSVKEVGQNWSGINGATLSFDSNRAVVTIAAQSGSGLASDSTVPVQSGKKYKLEADVEIGTYTGTSVILNLLGTSSSAITIASSGVTRVSHIFDASSTTNTSARVLRGSADTGTLFIDNVSVVEITDDTDLPRIDYTDGEGSLLLEPQRTNLVTYSEDLTQWVASSGIQLTSGQLGVGNSNDAWKIQRSLAYDNIRSVISFTSTSTVSVYAKKGSYNFLRIAISAIPEQCYFDLENGIIGTTSNLISSDIKYINNGWYRCSMTFNNASGTGVYIQPVETDGGIGNSGTGHIFVQYPQTEAGSYPTSYIPTNGSTVTRNADVCNNSGSAQDFNSEEGVLYAEISALANYNTQRWLSLSDGTHSNAVKIGLLNSATDFRFAVEVRSANSTQAFMTYNFGAITPTMTKVAIKFKQNDFALWVNGTERATDTNGNTPTGLNELAFDRGDGGQDFEGNVKCVAVFTEALTDEQLEKLTS